MFLSLAEHSNSRQTVLVNECRSNFHQVVVTSIGVDDDSHIDDDGITYDDVYHSFSVLICESAIKTRGLILKNLRTN